jgi:hypothetical protein
MISFGRESLHGVLGWEICPGFPFLLEVGKTAVRIVYHQHLVAWMSTVELGCQLLCTPGCQLLSPGCQQLGIWMSTARGQ